jgi:hypothetical protein
VLQPVAAGFKKSLTIGGAEFAQQLDPSECTRPHGANQRDREMTGEEAQPGVKTDVVDGAGHRLEPDRGGLVRAQPIRRLLNDSGADSTALPLGTDSQWSHPSFGPGLMSDVERNDAPVLVTPNHRAGTCVP